MPLILLMNFLLAISTAIGMAITPLLVTDFLGYSLFVLGVIEGMTEFLSNVLRLYSGVLFDKVKNKKALFVASTGMALGSKLLLFIPSALAIISAKALERVANGAFASPRDAYAAEKAKNNKGTALALLNLSKAAGCIIGPITVSVITGYFGVLQKNIGLCLTICCMIVAPAFLCSFFLSVKSEKKSAQFSLSEVWLVIKKTKPVLILTFIYFLARFHDGLLTLYLKDNGFPEWFYVSTISIFNIAMFVVSPWIGSRIDAGKLQAMLFFVVGALIAFQLSFYHIEGVCWSLAIIGLICWGIQRAGAQIVFASMIFKSISKELYGTAIGLYYLISGVGGLIAASLSGRLSMLDPKYPFIFTGAASLGVCIYVGFSLKRTQINLEDKAVGLASL